MSSIKTEKATVSVTETTIREILSAIERAKETVDFIDDPYPLGDMDVESAIESDLKRGRILVESEYSLVRFFITLEVKPNTQESLGYHLHESNTQKSQGRSLSEKEKRGVLLEMERVLKNGRH